MKTKEFDKLIKKHSPQSIIIMFLKSKINLNNKQLDKVIEMKKGTEDEGHGGVSLGKIRKVREQ